MEKGLQWRTAMMTQIRREVSLDSQGQGSGGSLGNSRLTLSSRDTPLSLKSASLDLVDESIQVDLSADTVTYDSDDEMVKRRVSILRNKKGHPIYSREDIREQYCINKKEVEVLENARSIRLFGCLTNQQESSCNKNSILFSCMQKKKASSDENLYVQHVPLRQSAWSSCDQESEDKMLKDQYSPYDDEPIEGSQDSGEDDFATSGFRKRPKSFCLSEPRFRYSWLDGDTPDSAHSTQSTEASLKPRGVDYTGSASQQSIDSEGGFRHAQRPSHLTFGQEVNAVVPSHSVDELLDAGRRKDDGQDLFCKRNAKTPDISLDDRRQKHVSFDSTSLIRSNTVGGGLEDVDAGPAATSTPLNTQRRTFSPPDRHRSQERLLDSSMRPTTDFGKTADVSSSLSSAGPRGSIQHRPRRALMKTQATQTELTFKARFMLPAYLTLSPRATTQYRQQRSRSHRHQSASRLTKSRSAYGVMVSDDSDEEVMEVDLVNKHPRLLRSSAARASILRQRAVESPHEEEEEIMVSFKPSTPPKERVEVLIGPRTASRADTTDRSQRSESESSQRVLTPKSPTEPGELQRSELGFPEVAAMDEEVFDRIATTPMSEVKTLEQPDVIPVTPPNYVHEVQEDVDNEVTLTERKVYRFRHDSDFHESSSVKSSSESTQAKHSDGQESTAVSDIETFSNPSDESPTVTTDGTPANILAAIEAVEQKQKERVSKQGSGVGRADMLTSPESESSSSHFTERETSRSEMSTSSSNHFPKSVSSKSETEGEEISESSEYVTATEHSYPEKNSKRGAAGGTQKSDVTEDGHTSFESASSASLFSSPSSRSNKSPAPPSSLDGIDKNIVLVEEASDKEGEDLDQTLVVRKRRRNEVAEDNAEEHVESSDESTKKETLSSDSESCHESPVRFFLEEKESGEVTPVMDPSPEASSLQDAQTVVEMRSEGTSEEFLESMNGSLSGVAKDDRGNGETEESTDSSSVFSGFPEGESGRMSLYMEIDKRTSDELSTVSEVSEESSHVDLPPILQPEPLPLEKNSGNGGNGEGIQIQKKSSSSEYIPSETTTPSFDSTTSGSFILESASYAENDSYNSLNEEMLAVGGIPDKAFPEVREEDDRPMSDPAHMYSSEMNVTPVTEVGEEEEVDDVDVEEPGVEDVVEEELDEEVEEEEIEEDDEDVEQETTSGVEEGVKQDTDSSSPKLYPEETESSQSSTWCSEGAIPKNYRLHDTEGKKDRVRIKLESREPPGYLHLDEPRMKSRSPERRDVDGDQKILCSQCGEKIRDHGIPPPPGAPFSWDRQYQRPYWEVPGEHPPMWRARERERPGYTDMYAPPPPRYGAYSAPRWGEACHGAEGEIYNDEDEDAGVHPDSYRSSTWVYVSDADELAVWKQPLEIEEEVTPTASSGPIHPFQRSDSVDSTSSEHEFLRQYQAVTHRMVHRKSSVEMYRRLANKTFEVDKTVVVQRNNGEFGFRIHGSKPVVVSAIERGTAAETCGLEVGDIIISINNVNVLEASHSDVVKLAHTGTDTLTMEVARTCHVLAPNVCPKAHPPVYRGFLQRLSVGCLTTQRWCRRWFVLKQDGYLYWYRTPKDHEPLGVLVLQNQTASKVPDAGAPHAFKVAKYGGCPHYFAADDEEAASRWISALTQVATAASRVDPYIETSLKNVQLPTTSLPCPDCQGFLGKLSQRWKCWKRRYFILKDACLYFYGDRTAATALGMFHLHGYKVQSCSIQGKKNTFEAIPPEPRLKHLYFLSDSEHDKKRWLAALEYSIDRWIKVG